MAEVFVPLSSVDILSNAVLVTEEHLDSDHGENDINLGSSGRSLGKKLFVCSQSFLL